MANVPSSGHSIEWFRQKMQLNELSYAEMNERLNALSQKPTEILYFPFLTGMGSPWYMASMQGTFLGLSEHDDGMKILKAIMEGIQYQALWLLEILSDVHITDHMQLICAGGAVKNKYLMQLKADILNRTVNVSLEEEATLCGAVALYMNKNVGTDVAKEFVQCLLRWNEACVPCEDLAKQYRAIGKERYLPMVNILKNYYTTWREKE